MRIPDPNIVMDDESHEFAMLLAQYFEGTLSPARRRAIDRHLKTCAACRKFFEEAKEDLETLAAAPPIRSRDIEDSRSASGRARRVGGRPHKQPRPTGPPTSDNVVVLDFTSLRALALAAGFETKPGKRSAKAREEASGHEGGIRVKLVKRHAANYLLAETREVALAGRSLAIVRGGKVLSQGVLMGSADSRGLLQAYLHVPSGTFSDPEVEVRLELR
ncbi:MAG TPA: zf-HC2 domain-containing protein [Verrucomicrobiota bacterium]|nr:zf-HC2 domain-containing protein [Verrucomicrobiota bacterium]HNU50324.1 zf-HC2 domain-containing protein [Verrucomicrobiota bacterium]